MRPRRTFTSEFKHEAVRLLEAGARPAADIACDLGIPRNRLYKWQATIRSHGVSAFPGRADKPGQPKTSPGSNGSWPGSRRSATL